MQNSSKIQLTSSGLQDLNRELSELTEVKRPAVVERLSNARLQGDLSENNDYHSAKEELEFLDGRIAELEAVLNNAVVAETESTDEVAVGTKVTLKTDGKNLEYTIVGEWEADPMKSMISNTSPLGQALSGKKVGDKVEVEAPAGKLQYEILAIE